MTSGPVVVQVLEGENAIALNRELMGATNPQEAEAGTIQAPLHGQLLYYVKVLVPHEEAGADLLLEEIDPMS